MEWNKNNVWLAIAAFIVVAVGFQPKTLAAPSPTGADLSRKARLVETYGKLPLSFEQNRGQTGDQVKFLSRGPGYTLFLTSTEAVLSLRKRAAHQAQLSEKSVIPGKAAGRDPESREIQKNRGWMPASAGMTRAAPGDDGEPAQTATLRIQLVGANPKSHVSGVDALPGKVNYFRGNKPNQWRTEIPTYGKVKYEDVYPGIDLVYYGNQQQLEHDFVVAPGVDPRTIRLAFAGAERVGIDGQGDLVLKTAGGDVRLQKPVVYQNVNGNRHKIAGRYVLHSGKRKDKQQVGFQVAAYDKGKPLIIDPVLAYSTYLGGSGQEFGDGIAVDNQGNAYVTGTTFFSDFPVTAGAFQTSFNGGSADVFIAKFNTAGSALLFSTYLGGSRDDQSQSTGATPRSIAVDTDGNAYVTGQTTSPDFPVTTGAFQTTLNDAAGAFVTKLTADGSALVYSTYLSGSGNASGSSIIIDNQGNAYVTGYAFPDFPATSVFGVTGNGNSDVFVAKLNTAGSALVYSALVGGSSHDYGIGIALDSIGDVYITGQTDSADFPIVNALYETFNGQTAFVTKLNPSGFRNTLLHLCTYRCRQTSYCDIWSCCGRYGQCLSNRTNQFP